VEAAQGTGAGRRAVYREVKLADVPAGAVVTLTLSADQKAVQSILAEGPVVRGLLKAVDPEKNTLTVSLPQGRGEQAAADKTYALARDAEVAVDDGRGRRFSVKEAKLADLAAGALATLWLSADQRQVQAVLAEGPTLYGVVKALDGGKNTVTVVLGPGRDGQAGEERTLVMAADAGVLLDDGKGRRLSLKEGKLADVPAGAAVTVRLSPDQRWATLLRAEGPSLAGLIKAVDGTKGVLTFALPAGRGENPEEKTLPVAKDARIVIDGNETRLADIKVPDRGLSAVLRLSLDQKTIQAVMTSPSR
jgi:hypothetical protein